MGICALTAVTLSLADSPVTLPVPHRHSLVALPVPHRHGPVTLSVPHRHGPVILPVPHRQPWPPSIPFQAHLSHLVCVPWH